MASRDFGNDERYRDYDDGYRQRGRVREDRAYGYEGRYRQDDGYYDRGRYRQDDGRYAQEPYRQPAPSREDAARARLAQRQARTQPSGTGRVRRVQEHYDGNHHASPKPVYGGAPRGRDPHREGPLPDGLPQWLPIALIALAAVVAVVLLVNVVSCAGGASTSGTEALGSGSQAAEGASQDAGSTGGESPSSATGASDSTAATTSSGGGVESPWTDNGLFSTGDAELDAYVKELCDAHSSPTATYSENAYDTFMYVVGTGYVERENNQSPYGEGWDLEYAKQYFQEGESGNCFNFAAVNEYLLKYFGYADAEAEPCVVKLESDSWGDHALVFVTNKVNNQRCLVDAAAGSSGWMLDIDEYTYDVRNIEQNPTVKGNADAIDDEPTRIQPGNLTE